MSLPLLILSFGAIFVGYLGRDAIIGVGSDFFSNAIFIHPDHINMLEAEFIPINVKWTPVIFSMTGASLAAYLYYNPIRNVNKVIYTFLNNKWHWDFIYNQYIGKPVMKFGHDVSYKILDRGLIEYVGPTGIIKSLSKITKYLSELQSGMVYNYAFIIFLSATIILIILVILLI